MAGPETRPSFRLPWTAGSGEPDGHDTQETGQPDMTETEAPVLAQDETTAVGQTADAAPARRATKFMADLSRAMQAAAENERNATMARFEVDAKAAVEEIQAAATDEVATPRRRADDDVAAVRGWSKAEIA